jgi:hypothetical protein
MEAAAGEAITPTFSSRRTSAVQQVASRHTSAVQQVANNVGEASSEASAAALVVAGVWGASTSSPSSSSSAASAAETHETGQQMPLDKQSSSIVLPEAGQEAGIGDEETSGTESLTLAPSGTAMAAGAMEGQEDGAA